MSILEPGDGSNTPTYPFGLDYAAYGALMGGAAIPEAKWRLYAFDAACTLYDVTYGRSEVEQIAEITDRLKLALCRVANELWRADNSVKSETVGGYSVQYGETFSRGTVKSFARSALAGTGLTNTNLNGNALTGSMWQLVDRSIAADPDPVDIAEEIGQ